MIPVKSPLSRVPLPRVEPREAEPLPAAAVLALADTLPGGYRVPVPWRPVSGCSEATGLTMQRVNFLQLRILVVEQEQNGALAPLKTRASRRAVLAKT